MTSRQSSSPIGGEGNPPNYARQHRDRISHIHQDRLNQSPSKKSLPPLAVGWPLTQPNHPFSLGGKSCVLTLMNIIPEFPMKNNKFLYGVSSKLNRFCVYMYGYKKIQGFLWKRCWLKNWCMWGFTPNLQKVAEIFCLQSAFEWNWDNQTCSNRTIYMDWRAFLVGSRHISVRFYVCKTTRRASDVLY